MSANHRRSIRVQSRRIRHRDRDSGLVAQIPAVTSYWRKRTLRMLAGRSVTCATGDSQFRDFGVPGFLVPVESRLRLDVVAEDAIRVPFRDGLRVSGSIRMKKRSI